MGEVNGRLFFNNVSHGIYGDAVRRVGYRDAKAPTLLRTAEAALCPSSPAPTLRLVDDAGREHARLAVVLVSNNPYALDRSLLYGVRPALGHWQARDRRRRPAGLPSPAARTFLERGAGGGTPSHGWPPQSTARRST